MFWLKKYKQAVYRIHKSLISVNFLLFSYFALSTQANVATIMDKSLGTLAFLGCFLMPNPSLHPTNKVGRVHTEFFSSFNFVQGGGRGNCKTISKRMDCFMREIKENYEYCTVPRTLVHDCS